MYDKYSIENGNVKYYDSTSYYAGRYVDSSITKTLYIPSNCTIPDDSNLKTQLIDKCGFVISATLPADPSVTD